MKVIIVGGVAAGMSAATRLRRLDETADILVLASPVYFMRTSARMAAMIDRFRVFVFGNQEVDQCNHPHSPEKCEQKVKGADAVAKTLNEV